MTRSAESGRLTKQSQTLKITSGWIRAVSTWVVVEAVDDGVTNCKTVCSFVAAMVEFVRIENGDRRESGDSRASDASGRGEMDESAEID